jgi:hypothetical protein
MTDTYHAKGASTPDAGCFTQPLIVVIGPLVLAIAGIPPIKRFVFLPGVKNRLATEDHELLGKLAEASIFAEVPFIEMVMAIVENAPDRHQLERVFTKVAAHLLPGQILPLHVPPDTNL